MLAVSPKWTGRIWPNGKFGVSRVRETPFLSLCESHRETAETEFNSLGISAHGVEAVLKFRGKWEDVMRPDLSNVPKSPIAPKRGLKGITRYGRNLISSAAVVAESKYDRRLLTFATVTLPSAPVDCLQNLCAAWSTVVKSFVKNLTRGLKAKSLPAFVFGVSEIQEKRFERTGVPALHLHCVFVGRNSRKSSWQVDRKNIRRWWKKAIAPYLPADTNYDSVENVQQVKKSSAAYLGKYMSKGADSVARLVEQGLSDWIPSAWYTITHSFRREVLSKVLRGEEVGFFLNWLCHNVMVDFLRWVAPVMARSRDGTEFAVGFAGSFTESGLQKVVNLFG